MHIETFSSDQVPQTARSRQFQREMERRFSLGLVVEATSNEPLRTRVTAYSGRRLRFAELEFSPHRTHCSQPRCDAPGRLLISIHQEGSGLVSQSGRSQQIDAGQMFVLDPSRPFSIETSAVRARSVYLSADSVRAVLPQLEEVTARRIDLRNGPGRIFASMVDQMFAIAHELDEHATDSLADALPYMLVTALDGADAASLECSSRLTLLHRHRIQQFAKEHLRDPRLDAKMIAEGVSLSIRRVYELFNPSSASLMKWVWHERLERCRRDLGTSALRARPIGAIAFAWGFSDICHFSRTFKQRYGMTPREWRTSKTEQCD
ncbi:AraC-like DNA-binding protein [Povalibacter uvarum]|uniref:AraC-like DNA-binding protein n=1 Tax=Povalibacter uvarum TaxID=732238 RepID=A0A841HV16_9GAMM|nr:helix-turn-helix domain-containing protein [Povalibacter uvarum]MBB6096504.1 AraC-like DNA-binding protein [Povalibacter uvarum]